MRDIVLVDVDTQADFMLRRGALYVDGAEGIVAVLGRLIEAARGAGVPILQTSDAHPPKDPEFRQFPPHCVAGTPGARRIPETDIPGAVVVPPGGNPGDALRAAAAGRPVVVEKVTFTPFSNPAMRRIVESLAGRAFLVCGVATDYCVRATALGLVECGAKVELIADAVRAVDPSAEKRTLAELVARGVTMTTSETVLREMAERRPARPEARTRR